MDNKEYTTEDECDFIARLAARGLYGRLEALKPVYQQRTFDPTVNKKKVLWTLDFYTARQEMLA